MNEIEKRRSRKANIRNIVKTSNTEREAVNRLLLEGLVVTNSQAKRIYSQLKSL